MHVACFGNPRIHCVATDPGVRWQKDPWIAINVDHDDRTTKIITPNVIALRQGGYRMYYTALWYGPNRFEDSTAVICSAISEDAVSWYPESGERLRPFGQHAKLRVLCPDVVTRPEGGYRMYFEASAPQRPSMVLSAVSSDGLAWEPEAGVRVGDGVDSFGSPRCLYFQTDEAAAGVASWGCRLYFHRRPFPEQTGTDAGLQIASAVGTDGLHFEIDPGARLVQEDEREAYALYAPEVLLLGDGSYRMYYAAWSEQPWHGRVFGARSWDGLTWHKDKTPCLEFGGQWDAVKVSEPCVIGLPDGRFRMFYEGCDEQGTWRILSATSADACRGLS